MKTPLFIKAFISRFTNKPIDAGFGISCDDKIVLPEGVDLRQLDKSSTERGYYRLRPIPGPFEFIGHIKVEGKNVKPLYQLRHKYTGETFNVSRGMLDFLFEKYDL